jgi:hypothetical protein
MQTMNRVAFGKSRVTEVLLCHDANTGCSDGTVVNVLKNRNWNVGRQFLLGEQIRNYDSKSNETTDII